MAQPASGCNHHQPALIAHKGVAVTRTAATATGHRRPSPSSHLRIAVPANMTARIAAANHGTRLLNRTRASPLVAIGYFLSGQAFAQATGLADIGGLLQRLTVVVGWGWLTLLAIHLRNTDEPARPPLGWNKS
ncbi:hypothetical protein [Nonomuraea helvata]|uniref:Uncharacterized protein n=2 Tax=Nonomuraea helvata TaxID=37484 RepID=A0ABV5SGI5_9ACTN